MPPRELPPLSPEQVVAVQDALLANADQLLTAATNLLESNVPLARSLAILALEESGKAIALHDRRVAIAYATEGEPFVTADLQELWSSHDKKLSLVHQFLAEERYWFGEEPSDPEENSQALGAIRAWSRRQDRAKQRGFYVDLDKVGNVLDPAAAADEHALRIVIAQVHQIGWQLRLGEHIEAKRQAEEERGVAPAESDEIESFRTLLARSSRVDSDLIERMLTSMQEGTPGRSLNNSPYRIRLPSNSFDHLGHRGYEAETRELDLLRKELDAENASVEHPPS
jgi:AbiV family abortive infection protein